MQSCASPAWSVRKAGLRVKPTFNAAYTQTPGWNQIIRGFRSRRQFSLPLSPVSYLVTENRRRKNQRDGIGADDIVILDVDAMYYPQKYIDYEGYVHPKGNPQEASFVHPFLLVEITPMCSIISFLKSAI